MKSLIKAYLRRRGFDIVQYRPQDTDRFIDLPPEQNRFIAQVQKFTMTSGTSLASLAGAIQFIATNRIPGDIAECGVWRGGSIMLIALMLRHLNDTTRELYLYDTFEGMSAPTDADTTLDGRKAADLLNQADRGNGEWHDGIWCYASLEHVRANMESTGYPMDKIHFIKGKVEQTMPGTLPGPLALLRLDTDWYESTKHELEHLFPLVQKGGILVLDDYGVWGGARKAVDEYFQGKTPLFLQRVDECGRIARVC